MKWKLALLSVIILGGLGGSWIKNLPGFVTIAYEKTTYEMRLWIAVLFIILLFVTLQLIFRFIGTLFSSGKKIKTWRSNHNLDSARKLTLKGILAYAEGNWSAAEKLLIKSSSHVDTPVINFLVAAQAAQCLQAYERRDNYLKKAHQIEPAAAFAVGLTQAKLQIQQSQSELALATLNQLKNKKASHPFVLKSLCELFVQLKDWQALEQLLPSIKKSSAFSSNDIQDIEEKYIAGKLQQQAKQGHIEALQNTWFNLPAKQRKSKNNILLYADYLIHFQQMTQAEDLLKPLIKKEADEKTLSLYGNIISERPEKQLTHLEAWYKSNPSAPKNVYLVLGKIAFNAKLWGKSCDYLKSAIEKQPSAEAFLFLAKNMEYLNNQSEAMGYYKQGLELLVEEKKPFNQLLLSDNSDDLISANLLPQS